MTAAKNVYALMLALVIVLSGCFGMTGDESDAQDSGSDENVNDMGDESDHAHDDGQERTWYTSGGTYPVEWIDSGMPDFFLRCQFKHIRLPQARQTGPRHARLPPSTPVQAHQVGPSMPDWA